eukprot:TRINITY_DN33315_c0_g1_i4.p2 TRINITY_DN33315_c0_g1~~TRINITY_DN33315_c0_g1_i4.p2  ORF type:complete len:269 (+),score=64.97 TRINITY_DN33315_c0_g1_i4:70-876(+)
MGSCLSPCVFPVPPRQEGSRELQQHPGLVWLTTSQGRRIPALHIRYQLAQQQQPLTLLVTHGNSEHLRKMERLSVQTRCDVFAVEYEGYGLAEGSPSEAATYADAAAGLDYLTRDCGIPLSAIVLFGRSLGSGPACELARQHPCDIGGVVLQSPMKSALQTSCLCPCAPVCPCLDLYRNAAKLPLVQRPVFIIHGTEDRVVPFSHGRGLHALCRRPHPPLWVPNAGHNNVEHVQGSHAFHDALRSFLDTLRAPSAPAQGRPHTEPVVT